MLKKFLFLPLFFNCHFLIAAPDTLVVYAYDSLTGKGSLGEVLEQTFLKETGSKIRWVPFASEGESLNQIEIEREGTQADVLLGVDTCSLERAKKTGLFSPLSKKLGRQVEKELLLDADGFFLPFDFGYLAFIYDSTKAKSIPTSLKQFSTDARFGKRIIVQDPRTSSIGFSFLVWTHAVFKGAENEAFWKGFSHSVLTFTPGWSAAYGMFLKGESDYVLSYSTSPAYHMENEKTDKYQAVPLSEGHFKQVEFVGVSKYTKKKELSEKFVSILLSESVQTSLPTRQWMYPARAGVRLPPSFSKLPIPKGVSISPKLVEESRKSWIRDWSNLMVKAK